MNQPPCNGCGGPHPFDTSVPSAIWNRVIRGGGKELPDYLCLTCIVKAFVSAGESFTAELWGNTFHGVPIEIRIFTKAAQDAAAVQLENNELRAEITRLRQVAAPRNTRTDADVEGDARGIREESGL